MERRSEKTKALLGEEFKELVVEKSFEKITIKMITDAAGVIRPTFIIIFKINTRLWNGCYGKTSFKA
ncbi:MAG: hypothetical protein ACLR71_10610 [[Clostridium] scindens]